MSYRKPSVEESVWTVPFAALSPETQERLRAACAPTSIRPLLAAHPAAPRRPGWWLVNALLVAGLASLPLGRTFGSIDRGPLGGLSAPIGWASLGWTAAFIATALAVRAWLLSRQPVRGLFLFPRELVDARSPELVLRSMDALTGISRQGPYLALRFSDGETYYLPAVGAAIADLEARLRAARERADQGEAVSDDPFAQERSRWHLTPARAASRWGALLHARMPWIGAALLLSVTLAQGAFWVARQSDRQGIERAFRDDRSDLLTGYVEAHGSLSELADQRLLGLATRSRSNDALLHYLHVGLHPRASEDQILKRLGDCAGLVQQRECQSLVKELRERGDEVVQRLMRIDLVWATHYRDTGALWKVSATSPVPEIRDEAQATIRDLLNRARGDLSRDLPPGSPLVDLFGSIMGHLSRHDVTTRFSVTTPTPLGLPQDELQAVLRNEIEQQPLARWLRFDRVGSRSNDLPHLEVIPELTPAKAVHTLRWVLRLPDGSTRTVVTPLANPVPLHEGVDFWTTAPKLRGEVRALLQRGK